MSFGSSTFSRSTFSRSGAPPSVVGNVTKGVNYILGTVLTWTGNAELNGLEVTSPLILDKTGFYRLDYAEGSFRAVKEFSVIDLDHLKVRLENIESVGNSPSYRRMLGDMPKAYNLSYASRPVIANVIQQLSFFTNQSVTVAVYVIDPTTGEEKFLTKGVAESAGKFSVSCTMPFGGVVDVRVKILVDS